MISLTTLLIGLALLFLVLHIANFQVPLWVPVFFVILLLVIRVFTSN